MSIHQMSLQPRYFDFIKNGTKRIELRLYDEKRRKIQLGDIIEFAKSPENDMKLAETNMSAKSDKTPDNTGANTTNPAPPADGIIRTKVIGLLRYNSFDELFADFDISLLADATMTKQELLAALSEFYSPERQAEFGVIGIRVEAL